MDQKSLARWLKCILVGVGLCGVVIYAVVVPSLGLSLVREYPEFGYCFWPWLIFILATGLPCYAALFLAWKVASNIGRDRSFSTENARLFKMISVCAATDAGFFFLGNVVFLLLNMSHPGVVLFSFLIVFAGVAVAVAAAALSHLVQKAAALQEQSDLTI